MVYIYNKTIYYIFETLFCFVLAEQTSSDLLKVAAYNSARVVFSIPHLSFHFADNHVFDDGIFLPVDTRPRKILALTMEN